MALAIDTSQLTEMVNRLNWLVARDNGPFKGPFQIFRACALGTVIHDASSISRLAFDRPAARQEALDWQADPDGELNDVEVLHHLNQQAMSSPLLKAAFSHTDSSIASTTVMTSCAFPLSSLPARAKGRPLSSFHRSFIRVSWFDNPGKRNRLPSRSSDAVNNIFLPLWLRHSFLRLAQRRSATPCRVDRSDQFVVWQLQLDVVDFSKRRNHPNCHLQRRRRSTIDCFHRVALPLNQGGLPPSNSPKETKQFRGVRYREDHKRWTAEMKPPKKTKVHFGEFNSQTQAARVVDVAFHYYGKRLNFSDTPHFLEERPIPANVNAEDKLNFVKEQAKWVSSIYSTLLSSRPFHGEVDGQGDDSVYQPQLSLHLEATGDNGSAEDSLGVAEIVGGAITDTIEPQQGLPEWGPLVLPSNSPTIIEGEDGVEHSTGPASINLRSSSEPSCASHAQFDDEEQVMSERMNAKQLRLSISSHQLTPPSNQVAVADSPWRACTVASPVFPVTVSPYPGFECANRGDHGICEHQPWDQWDPLAGSRESNAVVADGVNGVVTGMLQEQQALSVRIMENPLCPSSRSPSSFIDIRDSEYPGASSSTNYRIPSQFSSESQQMLMDFLMMPQQPSFPSSPTPFDYLPVLAQCLWEQ